MRYGERKQVVRSTSRRTMKRQKFGEEGVLLKMPRGVECAVTESQSRHAILDLTGLLRVPGLPPEPHRHEKY